MSAAWNSQCCSCWQGRYFGFWKKLIIWQSKLNKSFRLVRHYTVRIFRTLWPAFVPKVTKTIWRFCNYVICANLTPQMTFNLEFDLIRPSFGGARFFFHETFHMITPFASNLTSKILFGIFRWCFEVSNFRTLSNCQNSVESDPLSRVCSCCILDWYVHDKRKSRFRIGRTYTYVL